ncbi:MAG: queuosine precursor transporter [Pseudomonadota bacterium]
MVLLSCGCLILLFSRLYGLAGLYVYLAVATFCGNLQVLKATKFSFFPEPVALGTIVFSSTYLCTNIITEHYGAISARRGVWLSFIAMLMVTVLMTLTLGWPPAASGTQDVAGRFQTVHNALQILFTPAPAIMFASLSAYIISQYNDIGIYRLLKYLTNGQQLWLRSSGSMAISALVDNTIFSVLAWVVFATKPLDWHTLVFTYILGTFLLRLALAALNTPFVYLSYAFKHKEQYYAPV